MPVKVETIANMRLYRTPVTATEILFGKTVEVGVSYPVLQGLAMYAHGEWSIPLVCYCLMRGYYVYTDNAVYHAY